MYPRVKVPKTEFKDVFLIGALVILIGQWRWDMKTSKVSLQFLQNKSCDARPMQHDIFHHINIQSCFMMFHCIIMQKTTEQFYLLCFFFWILKGFTQAAARKKKNVSDVVFGVVIFLVSTV